jgi:hypothetical protein
MKIKNLPKINFIIDLLLFICIIPIASIGIIIEYVLPPEQRGGKDLFLGLTRHGWGNIHWYFSIAFVILLIIHIILHWNWIKCMVFNLLKRKKKFCK